MYILRCADGSFYVGYAGDLAKRLAAHTAGVASSYTARHLPVDLLYAVEFNTELGARKRERQLKRWTRRKKEALISRDRLRLKTA